MIKKTKKIASIQNIESIEEKPKTLEERIESLEYRIEQMSIDVRHLEGYIRNIRNIQQGLKMNRRITPKDKFKIDPQKDKDCELWVKDQGINIGDLFQMGR